jgi:hypothetical protein
MQHLTKGFTVFTHHRLNTLFRLCLLTCVVAVCACASAAEDKILFFPKLAVLCNNHLIASGQTTTALTNGTEYGPVPLNTPNFGYAHGFTLRNFGLAELNFTSSVVDNDDGQPSDFAFGPTFPSGTIAAGAEASYFIYFQPTANQSYGATVRLTTNDPDFPIYTFRIHGTGSGTFEIGPPNFYILQLNEEPLIQKTTSKGTKTQFHCLPAMDSFPNHDDYTYKVYLGQFTAYFSDKPWIDSQSVPFDKPVRLKKKLAPSTQYFPKLKFKTLQPPKRYIIVSLDFGGPVQEGDPNNNSGVVDLNP